MDLNPGSNIDYLCSELAMVCFLIDNKKYDKAREVLKLFPAKLISRVYQK